MESETFGGWLRNELSGRDMGVKTLARRLAESHPEGPTYRIVESYRSSLRRYLAGKRVPSLRMRTLIAEALGVDESEMPSGGEEDSELSAALIVMVQALQRHGKTRELATVARSFSGGF